MTCSAHNIVVAAQETSWICVTCVLEIYKTLSLNPVQQNKNIC